MPDTLLTTKLYIPPARSDHVARPHLIERLNVGLERKLTLISGPVGFGKTTLLADWARQCERSVAWISLNKGDNDPARFLAYLVAALQTIERTLGKEAEAMLQSPQTLPAEAILTTLINELADASFPILLVLDDYHVIETQSIHDVLGFLLDHQPPEIHLVIASRVDPPLPLARMRARGELSELRAADLRFTPDEAVVFLNQVMGLLLSADDVTTLEQRTEGWIAGLQLAALSMQGQEERTGFIAAFAGRHHYIADYLVDEVLKRQTEDVLSFLLQTSILERLCGPLCNKVTGGADGQAMLERLERANLFVVPLDDERRWYRYHHLFADVLRARLRRTLPASESELHLHASQWYEEAGLTNEAIEHALAVEDFARAARLIDPIAQGMVNRFEVFTLGRWIESLPDTLLFQHPRIAILYAMTLSLTNRFEEWTHYLDKTEQAARADLDSPEMQAILGQILVQKCIQAFLFGDFPLALARIQEANQTRSELGRSTEHWALTSIHGYSTLQWHGDVETGLSSLVDSFRMAMGDKGTISGQRYVIRSPLTRTSSVAN